MNLSSPVDRLSFAKLIAAFSFAMSSSAAVAQDACALLMKSTAVSNRASEIRSRVAGRGEEYVRNHSRQGLIETDVLAIGAGPVTAAFAVNYRGGRFLALEATPYAGTFDRGRGALFMNLAERGPGQTTGRPVYHIAGSPISIDLILENPNVARVRVGARIFPDAGAVGDLTLEALDAAKAPVLFNTRAGPIQFARNRFIVNTDSGLTIKARQVIMGGLGEPRMTFPGETEGSAAWIYVTDKQASHRRVLVSDDFAVENSESLVMAGHAVVTGDSYGALVALDKLLKNPKVTRVLWIGKTVPAVAETEPELYKLVLDGIRAERVFPIRGATAKTYAVANRKKVGVQYVTQDGGSLVARDVVVSQHVLAMGYLPGNSVFGVTGANPVGETVTGFLPKASGVKSDVETEIARNANGVYFLSFRQGISDTAKHWSQLGLRGWHDFTFRAAALADQLSPLPRTPLILTRKPVTRKFFFEPPQTNHHVEEIDLNSAELDLRKVIGSAFLGTEVTRKNLEAIQIELEIVDSAWIVTTTFRSSKRVSSQGGFIFPNFESTMKDPLLQQALAALLSSSKRKNLKLSIPLEDGQLVLHRLQFTF